MGSSLCRAMFHRPGFDPLERRLPARERDELALHPVDVVDLRDRAPHLDRIRVEADHVGAVEEGRIDLLPVRRRRGPLREVIREREEGDAPRPLRLGQLARVPHGDVRLVGVMPADLAGTGDPGGLRIDGRHRASGEAVELLVRVGAAHAEEEVDAGSDRRGVVRGALAPDHARKDRVAVQAQGRGALDRWSSGREGARGWWRAGGHAGRERRRKHERRSTAR